LSCVGCSSVEGERGRLAITPEVARDGDRVVLETGIDFEPSTEMREALARGVDLQIDVVIRLRRRLGPIWLNWDTRRIPVRISHLPLTRQWRLETQSVNQNFPRLWLLLEALNEPLRFVPAIDLAGRTGDEWQIQARAVFSRAALPAPMHLPALFSTQWRLFTRWHAWPLSRF